MAEPSDAATIREILGFWFSSRVEPRLYDPDPEIDREIIERFYDIYVLAFEGKLADWMETAEGALALVILLDQFPRNMFRGSHNAYASDEQAREISRAALASSFDQQRPEKERTFFYLPLMHSEDMFDQTECVRLFRRLKTNEEGLESAIEHREIISRFGRFPHRNRVLGRESSDEEHEFLKTHSGF